MRPLSTTANPDAAVIRFQVLCIQGFLTCRKHAERIILLVEMLQVRVQLSVGSSAQIFYEPNYMSCLHGS